MHKPSERKCFLQFFISNGTNILILLFTNYNISLAYVRISYVQSFAPQDIIFLHDEQAAAVRSSMVRKNNFVMFLKPISKFPPPHTDMRAEKGAYTVEPESGPDPDAQQHLVRLS